MQKEVECGGVGQDDLHDRLEESECPLEGSCCVVSGIVETTDLALWKMTREISSLSSPRQSGPTVHPGHSGSSDHAAGEQPGPKRSICVRECKSRGYFMTIQAMLAQNCLSFCMQQAGEQVSLKGTLHPTQTKQRKPHNAKAQLNDV